MGLRTLFRRGVLLFQAALKQQDLMILGILVVLVALAWIFIALSGAISRADPTPFDRWVLLAMRQDADGHEPVGPAWLPFVMTEITALGGAPLVALLTIVILGFLLLAGQPRIALLLVVVAVGTAVSTALLKGAFGRPRPTIIAPLVHVRGRAFPSGHAMIGAALYPTLGALLARALTKHRLQIYCMVMAITLTILIGISRVYLGVHYPTDVLAGWTIGFGWALLCGLLAWHVVTPPCPASS